MSVTFRKTADGRWILGMNARPCPYCGAEPITTVSACGRAEIRHAPTACCTQAARRHAGMRTEAPA